MSAQRRWIAVIVGLLSANVAATSLLAYNAHDGTDQVIPDYYDRAVHYDDTLDRDSASHALGWTVGVAIVNGRIEVEARDAHGAPIDGARVHVTGYQRAHLGDALQLDLVAVGAGRYRASPQLERSGMHDLTVTIEREGARYTRFAAVEAR